MRYEWLLNLEETPLGRCPQWLIELLSSKSERAPRAEQAEVPSVDLNATIFEGRRNDTLTRLAGSLRQVGLSGPQIESTLCSHNTKWCRPPLPISEVVQISRSADGWEVGPARIDRRLINADLGDGPKLIAVLLAAGIGAPSNEDLARFSGVKPDTVSGWRRQVRDLEDLIACIPTRRFALVPRSVLMDHSVGIPARVTGLQLAKFMNSGYALVGQKALARDRGVRRATVSDHLRGLEAAGHLQIRRAAFDPEEGRRRSCNEYRWMEPGERR